MRKFTDRSRGMPKTTTLSESRTEGQAALYFDSPLVRLMARGIDMPIQVRGLVKNGGSQRRPAPSSMAIGTWAMGKARRSRSTHWRRSSTRAHNCDR